MHRSILAVLALALALGGCINANPISISASTLTTFRLTEVRVTIPPAARINYTHAENDFAASRGVSPTDGPTTQTLAESPERQAYIRKRAIEKMQQAFMTSVSPVLAGQMPVRIDVSIMSIDVPGGLRSVLVGGSATLSAQINLVDARTGAVLAAMPEQSETAARAGGFVGTLVQGVAESSGATREPYERMVDSLASDYARWLVPG